MASQHAHLGARLSRLPKSRVRQPGPGAADDPVAVPRANRSSIRDWMKPQIVVRRRNHRAQAA